MMHSHHKNSKGGSYKKQLFIVLLVVGFTTENFPLFCHCIYNQTHFTIAPDEPLIPGHYLCMKCFYLWHNNVCYNLKRSQALWNYRSSLHYNRPALPAAGKVANMFCVNVNIRRRAHLVSVTRFSFFCRSTKWMLTWYLISFWAEGVSVSI